MTQYTCVFVKSITKFSVLDFWLSHLKTPYNVKLSWDTLFDVDFFRDFVDSKYIPFKKSKEDKSGFNHFVSEYQFLKDSLPLAKENINIKYANKVSDAPWVVFSFRVLSLILSYYNEYYYESSFSVLLRFWIYPHKDILWIDHYFSLLSNEYSLNNLFLKDIIEPLIRSVWISEWEKKVYKFEIFWPNELILVAYISKIIKSLNSDAKIVLDISNANEQFDFTQWVPLIQNSWERFSSFFDFYIIHRDFWRGIHDILQYLNSSLEGDLKNVIYFDWEVKFNDLDWNELSEDMFLFFIRGNFNTRWIVPIFWKNAFFARFLPYKCYWNNCSFCAINSNNKFVYDRKYGYDYFIDAWIQFIEDNNIFSINFKDEAIPPSVIIKFAKKIIAKNISLNYQFRTRYDALFTKENCMILWLSWARYVWLWLESAVDRVNQEIGNKGNNDVSIGEKMKIIRYFEMAWVSIHNYCILWFPRETDDEIKTTYSFLISNIKKSKYFTCTPNLFSLMKGPRIFREREKYWVDISKWDLENPFKLSYDFTVDSKPRSMNLLRSCEREVHRTQFLPWIDKDNTSIHPRDFWDFIDRSFLFYLMKRYHETNPYYSYMNVNNDILWLSFEDTIQHKCYLSRFLQIYDSYDNQIFVYNWVECSHFKIDNQIKTLFTTFDNTKTLSENLKKHNLESRQDIVYGFLKNRTFLYKQV